MMNFLKKMLAALMALSIAFGFAACSSNDSGSGDSSQTKTYDSAEQLLIAVWEQIPSDKNWSVVGGIGDQIVDDQPSEIDLALAEQVEGNFNVPASLVENSESAAGMMDMMMANYFTASAWKLKSEADGEALVKDCETTLKETHWMCGMPEKYAVLRSGEYLIVVYGLSDKVDRFDDAAKTELPDLKIASGSFE